MMQGIVLDCFADTLAMTGRAGKVEYRSPERATLSSVGQGVYSPRRPTLERIPLKPCRGDIAAIPPLQGSKFFHRFVGRCPTLLSAALSGLRFNNRN